VALADVRQFVFGMDELEHGVPFLVGVGDLVIWARGSAAWWRCLVGDDGPRVGAAGRSGDLGGTVDGWNAARCAQAPVRAPPQGAATVIAVVRATGDIVGRVVVFGWFGSIIGAPPSR